MDRIAKVTVWTHCNDLGGKIWNSALRWTKKYAVFVELEDVDGETGVGECWCFDSRPDALVAFIRTEVAPQILGARIKDVKDILDRQTARATLTARHGILASAHSGIDIAIWDLRCRRLDLPLWKALNPNGSGAAHCYGSGGLYGENKGVSELAAEMHSIEVDGFDIVKMKVGALAIEEDLERVNAVLSALAPTTKLIIDGVYSYTADETLRLFENLPTDRIEAFQSPLNADDIRGMARLVGEGVPVMATEAEYRGELHHALIEETAITFLQTAPVACGGISRVRELSQLINGTGIQLSLEISSTALALMTAAQIAASDMSVAHVEHHFLHQVFFDRLPLERPKNADGVCELPKTAGLGVSPDYQALTLEFLLDEREK